MSKINYVSHIVNYLTETPIDPQRIQKLPVLKDLMTLGDNKILWNIRSTFDELLKNDNEWIWSGKLSRMI